MIVLYTGKPGSGKTYRVVRDLMKESGRYYILHNIPELKEELIEDGKYIQSWEAIPDVMTKGKQSELAAWARREYSRNVLFVFDECQTKLSRKTDAVLEWLSWHRHLDMDIWLICQSERMIAREYVDLCSHQIRAKRGITTGQFVYQYSVGGESYRTERVKQSNAVFASYKSFEGGGEVKKGRSKIGYYAMGACAVAIVLLIYMIGWRIPATFARSMPVEKKTSSANKKEQRRLDKGNVGAAVWKVEDKRISLMDELKKYSYAGVVGHRVMVQDTTDLSIMDLGMVSQYQLVEARGNSALVTIPDCGMVMIAKRAKVYATAQKIGKSGAGTLPPAGSRALVE